MPTTSDKPDIPRDERAADHYGCAKSSTQDMLEGTVKMIAGWVQRHAACPDQLSKAIRAYHE